MAVGAGPPASLGNREASWVDYNTREIRQPRKRLKIPPRQIDKNDLAPRNIFSANSVSERP